MIKLNVLKKRAQELYLETEEFVKSVQRGEVTDKRKDQFVLLDSSLAELQELHAKNPSDEQSVQALLDQTESLIEQVRPLKYDH